MSDRHKCEKDFPYQAYGPAITGCLEDGDGKLWAGNDEYETQVNFCPFCGYGARVKVGKDEFQNQ